MGKPLTVGSLFAGGGGFDLGFERAGFKTLWQVEIDSYCRKVLERHFPHAERFADIRDCCGWKHRRCPLPHHLKWVDVIAGGFPCQPVSVAGNLRAQEDERWLWPEMFRIIRAIRPRAAVMENVPGLLSRGMGDVLGDLASIGFDAEWESVSASAVGAHHERDRIWIVAYPKSQRWEGILRCVETLRSVSRGTWPAVSLDSRCANVQHLEQRVGEPAIFGSNDGLSEQVVQLAAIGNSVVPQIAQWIAERILTSISESAAATDFRDTTK